MMLLSLILAICLNNANGESTDIIKNITHIDRGFFDQGKMITFKLRLTPASYINKRIIFFEQKDEIGDTFLCMYSLPMHNAQWSKSGGDVEIKEHD